jgi:phenylpropionate dioxygenase-like ring-hydroxylating dioxygenase large terminal subunit
VTGGRDFSVLLEFSYSALTDEFNSAVPQPQASACEMLFGFWYRALPSGDVQRKTLSKTMLLELPLVIGRDAQNRAFALLDLCPHRGMPLSCGRFDGKDVECSYHGWKFDAQSGQCTAIPSLTSDSKLKVERIWAGHFPCAERDGFVWVFVPEQQTLGKQDFQPPAAPSIPVFSEKYKLAHISADLPCNVDHGIIGLMDPAHGPFVHQAWWWRSRSSIHEKAKRFEPIPNGFRMSAHTPSSNSAPYKLLRLYAAADAITTTIDFVLPNLRLEQIRAGQYWFSSLTTVTPIRRDYCRIDTVAAWNIFRSIPFVKPLFRFVGQKFMAQDQRTMEMQAEGLKYQPNLMLIDDADRPAKWYYQLKAAWLESRRSGGAMRHPLPEPVTLRWRS